MRPTISPSHVAEFHRAVFAIFISGLLLAPTISDAHSLLLQTGQFPPRSSNSGITAGPCGPDAHNAPVAIMTGSTVTVQWEETIHHTGRFQMFFSTGTGDAGLSTGSTPGAIKLFDIPQPDADANVPHYYSQTVTFPSTACTDCTLQLVQVNTDVTPSVYYFSCADIALSNVVAATPTPTPTPTPGSTSTPPPAVVCTPTPTSTPIVAGPTATPIPATFTNVNSMIIQPLCENCHTGSAPPDGYAFTSYAGVFAAVNTTTPTSSLLYTTTLDGAMPQGATALSTTLENLILRWIQAGAPNN